LILSNFFRYHTFSVSFISLLLGVLQLQSVLLLLMAQ